MSYALEMNQAIARHFKLTVNMTDEGIGIYSIFF